MRRAQAWFGLGFLVIGAIVLGGLLGEAGLRLFYPQQLGVWDQDRDGLALHRPGLVMYFRDYGVSASFNSVGMRDREHTMTKPNGVFRVLVLGDSFMEAHQVAFEASFPSLLERELGQGAGGPVEVVNASVSGWGTDDELKYLMSYGMRWKPDLILVAMTLHNDISDNLREQFHTMRSGALVEQPRAQSGFLEYERLRVQAFLASRFHAYVLVRRAWRAPYARAEALELRSHVVDLFKATPDEHITRGFELTTRLLERMQVLASSERSRVAVVLLPLAVQLSSERFAGLARAAPGSPALELDKPQRTMRRIGDQLGLPVIDLLPGFREWTTGGGNALFLERDGHWNERGHRLAARIVARELLNRHLGASPDRRATTTGSGAPR